MPVSRPDRSVAARIAWCLWAACVLGMPYLLSYPDPFGTVSFAGAYGFAALGMLMGLWLSVLGGTVSFFNVFPSMRAVLWHVGAALAVALGFFELIRLGNLLWVYEARGGVVVGLPSWSSMGASGAFALWLTDVAAALSPYEKLLVGFEAVMCGLCGGLSGLLHVDETFFACRKTGRRTTWDVGRFLAFALGLGSAWAWLLVMPHPEFRSAGLLYSGPWSSSVSPLVFMPAAMCFLGLLVLTRDGERSRAANATVYFCIGELAARCAMRVAPDFLAVGETVAMLITLAWVACAVLLVLSGGKPSGLDGMRDPDDGDGDATASLPGLSPEDEETLINRGLTPGELKAVRAAVAGLNSSEAAEILGVSSSTVRTYRARACEKLGMASMDDLVRLMFERKGLFAPPVAQRIVLNGDSPRTSSYLAGSARIGAIGTFCSIMLTLLPFGDMAMSWDARELVALGCAIGLFGTLFLPSGSNRFERVVLTTAYLVAVGILAFCQINGEFVGKMVACTSGRIAVFLATAFCVGCGWRLMTLLWSRAASVEDGSGAAKKTSGGVGTVAAAVLIVGAACLGEGVRLALLVICCAGMCIGFLRGTFATDQGLEHVPWTVSASVFGGVLGCVWEETWRGQYYQSLRIPCVVALLLLTCALVWLHRKQGACRLIPLLLPGLILMTYGLGFCAGLFVCCVALAVFGWYAETRECAENGRLLVPDASVCDPALFVAVGTGTGVYLVNAAGSQTAMLGSVSARTIFSVMGWIVGVVLCVLVIGALLHETCRRREAELACTDRMSSERIRGYLVGKGLGQLQADVTMLCIEGVGVSEIARRLNFARGTVDRARHDAFRVLGVCNRMQLLQKIREDIFI